METLKIYMRKLTLEEFKEKAKRELNSHDYINVMIYRGIIYFVLSVCIIIAPLMWAMAIITN